jgi:4-amino-4-deoxy-L-arabinose transferase-like glycosyltransferase
MMSGNDLQESPIRRIYLSTTGRYTALAVLAILVFLLAGLATLTLYPPVHVDEPWNADRAWNRLKTGENFTTMDVGPFPSGKGTRTAPIASGVLMWSYRFFGLGLLETRLPSLIFGCVLLMGTYFAGLLLYGPRSGLLACLVLAVSWPFLESSRRARSDIVLAAFVMVALSLALWGMRSEKPLPNLLAGVVIALSVAVHPNGALFVAALGVVYLARYGRRFFRRWEFWAFGAGCLLGSIYPGGLMTFAGNAVGYVASSQSGASGAAYNLGTTHAPPLMALDPTLLLASLLLEVRRFRVFDNGLELALIGASFLFLLVRRSESDRLLLTFLASVLALFVLLIYNKEDYYAILAYPFFLLAVAEMLVTPLRVLEAARFQRVFSVGVAGLFLFGGFVHFAWPLLGFGTYDYYRLTDRIRTVLPDEARILGRPTWWLGLSEYDYRSSFSLGYYDFDSDFDLTRVLDEVRPDVIIVDEEWQDHLADENDLPRAPGLYRFFKYPSHQFEDFLAQRGEKLLKFSDPWHGVLEVYAIDWE